MVEKQAEKVRIEQSKIKHDNIYSALSAFQGELKPMAKSGHVEFPTQKGTVKFDYTPLGEIMTNIYPLLAKHGLSVRHEVTKEGVEAILVHETYKYVPPALALAGEAEGSTIREIAGSGYTQGEIRSGIVPIKTGGEMKDTGAALTYARRYTLTMVLGIASEDDKDVELLEQSAKNAQSYAYSRAKKGIDEAKTVAAVEQATKVITRDVEALSKGKAGALGLTLPQYEELLGYAHARIDALEPKTTPEE